MSPELIERLREYGQSHLIDHYESLSGSARERLRQQLEQIDFPQLQRLIREAQRADVPSDGESIAAKASRARAPSSLVRLPRSDREIALWRAATAEGEALLKAGKVGAILVAGGQGTRLGFDAPKGTFPIGPISGHSLYQILAEQVLARSRRAGAAIPYYIMTSDATHEPTVAFFEQHRYFGLDPDNVRFFRQGTMPAVDCRTGQILLAAPGELATSPDGHGGVLAALRREGLLEEMRQRGIEQLHYHQVDNPLAIVCDPAFLGLHLLHDSEVSTKVVAKTGPEEKMGVVVEIDGVTQIIEYSDLPDEIAQRRTPDGELELWAGNTAIHVFNREFLERILNQALEMPFHRAHKKVPYLDATGNIVEPAEPNAWKFERFIFDVLPHARKALVVETDRAREFNPVKNREGVNSPADVQQNMSRLFAGWLREAGVNVPEGVPVEISPLFALDAAEVARRLDRTRPIEGPVYLGPSASSPSP